MSKLNVHRGSHPDPDDLLLFLDGELDARCAGRIREHLAACWQCRTERDELQKTIGETVRYRQTVFQSCFPSPPAPWCDIRSRMTDADVTLGSSSFLSRAASGIGTVIKNPRWWAPALAASLALVVVFQEFRNTATVSAAELLRKASIAADSQPRKSRKIQFRTRTRSLTRLTGQNGSTAPASVSRPEAESLAALEAMFAAAKYNWADPLSAQSYASWRDGLLSKSDDVENGDDCYVLTTSTGDSEIVEASLKLRASDLRPMEGTIEFRNHERLEMKDVSEDSVYTPESRMAGKGETRVMTPDSPMAVPVPRDTAAPPAASSATLSDEIRVFATLRRLDADLGEPIEVMRREDKLVVTGIGVAPERQKQIENEFASARGIAVDFPDPGGAAVPSASTRPHVGSSTAATPSMRQIESYLGGRAVFDQFADETFEVSDAVMARVHALRRLAERFPVEIDSKLTAADRRSLASMRLEHFGALSSKTEVLQQRMSPVLSSLGASPTDKPGLQLPLTWQAAAEEIFREARQVDTQLGILLGGAPGETSASHLLSNLNSLRTKINSYESLLKAAQ